MSRALLALIVSAWIPVALEARGNLSAQRPEMPLAGQFSPESQPRSSRLAALEFQTKHLEIAEIEERLQENGIRIRLDAALDGATACVVTEVLRDLLAERGFADAEVGQRTTLVPGPAPRPRK